AKERWRPHVVIRNPAARPRTGVAIIDLVDFIADVGVGPGSAMTSVGDAAHAESANRRLAVDKPMPSVPALGDLQPLTRSVGFDRVESPRHYPDNDLVAITRAAAWVTDVPGYGLVAHPFGGERLGALAPSDAVTVGAHTQRNAHTLRNSQIA